MQSETMNRVMQHVEELTASLSADGKLALAAVLTAQARQDGANGSASAPLNGAPQQEESSEEPDPYRQRELEWLKQHNQEYAGQYVALLGDRLVAHAETLQELDRLVKVSGVQRPAITRIKAPGEALFGGW
jgi:hypothetical protein